MKMIMTQKEDAPRESLRKEVTPSAAFEGNELTMPNRDGIIIPTKLDLEV